MIMAYGRVLLETRKVLLGHKTGDITSHYNALELAELIRATKRRAQGAGSTLLRVVTKQLQVVTGKVAQTGISAETGQERSF